MILIFSRQFNLKVLSILIFSELLRLTQLIFKSRKSRGIICLHLCWKIYVYHQSLNTSFINLGQNKLDFWRYVKVCLLRSEANEFFKSLLSTLAKSFLSLILAKSKECVFFYYPSLFVLFSFLVLLFEFLFLNLFNKLFFITERFHYFLEFFLKIWIGSD